MIAACKPYPAYKDSSVPWLGEVPEHWEILRLGSLGTFSASGIDKKINKDEPIVRMVNYLDIYRNQTCSLSNQRNYMKVSCPDWKRHFHDVKNGDMIFTPSSETIEDIGCSAVAQEDLENTVYSYHVVRYRMTQELDIGFKRFWCNNPGVLSQFSAKCKGTTRKILTRNDFRSVEVPVPPLAEQRLIGIFLSYMDRRIRKYIRAKQKLIKLLEEQKQAIIHRAVTGQIDVRTGKPYPSYKPSGVEWIGDVPEHWEVVCLGRLIELLTGFPFKSEGFTQIEGDIRLLRGVNISPGRIRWEDVVRWPQSDCENYRAFELRVGDIVLGMDRPIIQSGTRAATIGEADPPALLLQRVARIRPKGELHGELLKLLLAGKSFADYLSPIFTGISVPHLSPEQIKAFAFALPSADEQRGIVISIAETTRKTSTVINGAEHDIDLLREYRTRLIADVVTGKLDVREAAARLPEESEEEEEVLIPDEDNAEEESGSENMEEDKE